LRATVLRSGSCILPGSRPDHADRSGRFGNLEARFAAIEPAQDRTTALFGHDPVLADRIMDDPGDGLAGFHHRQHHAERGHARGEIEGAVDRIDHETEPVGLAPAIEQRRIFRDSLLADHHGAVKSIQQRIGDRPFGTDIGLGDQIRGGGLLLHRAIPEIAEPRHDFRCRHLGQQRREPIHVGGTQACS
jgi:hypothetical protein